MIINAIDSHLPFHPNQQMTNWYPELSESIDGRPLARHVSDLFWTFPYDRLPDKNSIVVFFMRPEVVMSIVVFYLISSKTSMFRNLKANKNSTTFQTAVALHNLVLAVFSGVTFCQVLPIVISHFESHGFFDLVCDPQKTLWPHLGNWALVFYLSKYYEFVDTWILILKVCIYVCFCLFERAIPLTPRETWNYRERNHPFCRPIIMQGSF